MLDLENAIRHRAYEIWQAEGQVHGRDLDHWLRAEAEVRSTAETEAAAKPRRGAARKRAAKARA